MIVRSRQAAPSLNLVDEDDVLPMLRCWRRQGLRTAIVTLIGVEGGAPRQPGAQMAVAEDGQHVGYLSGGCLEQAVVLEARDVISRGENRIVRYGKGSPYFDVRLPCGSGLDLYFDQALSNATLEAMLDLRHRRKSFVLTTVLSQGKSSVSLIGAERAVSRRSDDIFVRSYPAPLRLALIGNGPALTGIATLAGAAGIDTVIWSTDETTRRQLMAIGMPCSGAQGDLDRVVESLDGTSAAVMVFHDHDSEPDILKRLLETECFYLGVLGSRAVHRARLDTLRSMGVDAQALNRIHAPVGLISNAKSKVTFSFGVLAEMLAEAKACNVVP